MEAGKRHQDIADFMAAQREGRATGKQMVWNPHTSKFEVVASGTSPDNLPKVTREDLQAFALADG